MLIPIIMDADPGVDDALALILATRHPALDLLGVSVVCGNVGLQQAADNALKVLKLVGREDVPVFSGAGAPLVRALELADEVHGEGGLGGAELEEADAMPAGDSVRFLIESLRERPGQVTLVATGPLTNLALAEKQAPGVLEMARRVLVMGGALEVPGNVTPTAEYNFYADPHAAQQVLNSKANLTLVPLDVTSQVSLGPDDFAGSADGEVGRFCARAAASIIDFERRTAGRELMHLHDPLALALAADPDLCRVEARHIEVETGGELTIGQVVDDRRPLKAPAARAGRAVDCAVGVEAGRFLDMFRRLVLA